MISNKQSLLNRKKNTDMLAGQIAGAVDTSRRRHMAHGRGYVPSVVQVNRAKARATEQDNSAPKYKHDGDSYKRRESPMKAIGDIMNAGVADGVKVT